MNLESFVDKYWSRKSSPSDYIESPLGSAINSIDGVPLHKLWLNANPGMPALKVLLLGCEPKPVGRKESFGSALEGLFRKAYPVDWVCHSLAPYDSALEHMSRLLTSTVRSIMPELVVFVVPKLNQRVHFCVDGKVLTKSSSGKLPLAQKSDPHFKIYEGLQSLESSFEDIAYFMTHFNLMALTLDNCGIPWAYSVVSSDGNRQILDALDQAGWLPNNHFLGTYWDDDQATGGNAMRLAELTFEWFKQNYHEQILGCAKKVDQIRVDSETKSNILGLLA